MSQQTSLDGVLNLTEAMSNMDGDHELLAEIVEIFMETAPDQLQSLGRCIAAGDARETAIMAHGMKGGASNFCAGRFVASALKLEMLAKTGRRSAGGHAGELRRTGRGLRRDQLG
jgi:two-component system sensor histidine kinase/response regulator